MYTIPQSQTGFPLMFYMTSTTDNIAPGTSASPTVTISKNGAAFGSPAGAVTELANGWYAVAGNATDSNTLGPLLLHATGTNANPTDEQYFVGPVPVNAIQVGGTTQTARDLGLALPAVAPNAAGGLLITAAGSLDMDEMNVDIEAIQASTAGLTFTSANKIDANVIAIAGVTSVGAAGYVAIDAAQVISTSPTAGTLGEALLMMLNKVGRRNTATAGSSNTITLDAGASTTVDIFTGHGIKIIAGTGVGQTATITAYSAARVATITRPGGGNWTINPDATSVFQIEANWLSNLGFILNTALTETTGLIAAGFKQFFNIASPTSTMNTITAVTTAANLTTNNDKTGYGLSAAAVQAVWDALTSALTTTGSIGKLLVTNIDAAISSRSSYAGGDTAGTTTLLSRIASAITISGGALILTAAEHTSIAGDILNAVASSYNTALSIGNKINAAGSAGDPWTTAIPGAYGAGSAGNIVGNNLNATVSSRSTLGGTAQTGDCYPRLGAPVGASISADIAEIEAETDTLLAGVTVTTNNDKTGYVLSSVGLDQILMSDLASVPVMNATLKDALNWIFEQARNARTQNATTETIYKNDGTTPLATATKSDDLVLFTRQKYS